MRLLRALSLVYVAILVLAVAASLITILTYLYRIRCSLSRVATALTEVQERTAPLAGPLQAVDEVVQGTAEDLSATEIGLARADQRLAEIATALGAAEPAR